MKNLEVVIIAGGKGTRLRTVHNNPKILIKLSNNKILLNQILNNLKSKGINSVILLPGSKDNLIKKHINKKINNSFNISIIKEKKLLGTAGCLSKLNYSKLKKDILIIYGDLLFNINIKKFYRQHLINKSDVTIFSHPSDHLYDSDILDVDDKNKIKKIFFKPHKKKILSKNLSMAGIFIIKKKVLKIIPKNKKFDFSKNFLKSILRKKFKVTSYQSREYCSDLGTPQRLYKVVNDYKKSKHLYYSYNNKLPAIFVDRDGVINKDHGPLRYSDPLKFLSGSLKGLKMLRKSKYLIFLITNQGAIAKGLISYESAVNSFKEYEMYLSKKNFYFDKIYFCPHHPKKGFPNENKKYKISCSCRKPKPGLIYRAKKEFNIDLKNSYFIGDSINDYLAASRAGVKAIMIKKILKNDKNYIYKKNLFSAAKYVTNL